MRSTARKFFIAFIFLPVFFAAAICLAAPSAEDLLKRKGFTWTTAATEHLRLHFEPGTFAELRIEALKTHQEKAFARNLRLLKIDSVSYKTDIFIVASRERMDLLTGEVTNGIAFPSTKVACFVFSEKINGSGAHELMHIMSGNAWGMKFKTWLGEGLAGYADDIWHGYDLHALNKYLLERKKLIPLDDLIEDFNDQPDMISYPQTASFVKYLYEQYGADKIKTLWQNGSVKDLKNVLGKDISALEKEWQTKLLESDATHVKYDFPANK